MQQQLTIDGRSSLTNGKARTICLVLANTSDNAVKAIIARSTARTHKNPSYNATILVESEASATKIGCQIMDNEHFASLVDFQAFIKACPVRLHAVSLQLKKSDAIDQQLGNQAIRIITPTFSKTDLTEAITPSPIVAGSNYVLPNFFLGGVAELEITLYPRTELTLTLTLGAHLAERLVEGN